MYLEHFGLKEPPFRITPHTDFFFDGADRGATLEALVYAVMHDEGIVKVSGEVGSGKTMLCRVLLERLPEEVETIYLANPSLTRDELLRSIADELGVELSADSTRVVMRGLFDHLIGLYASGRRVVILIDEAHAMPDDTLEQIRLLSNLESSRHKLLQMVLFGQPELDETLAKPSMRQLKDRITHSFRMRPLTETEISPYVSFRMRAAGYRGPDVFTGGAIARIAKASNGLSRRINILADKALLAAFANAKHAVTEREVRAAIRDSEFGALARPARGKLAAVGAALLACGLASGFGLHWLLSQSELLQPPSQADIASAPARLASGPLAPPPAAKPVPTPSTAPTPATPVQAAPGAPGAPGVAATPQPAPSTLETAPAPAAGGTPAKADPVPLAEASPKPAPAPPPAEARPLLDAEQLRRINAFPTGGQRLLRERIAATREALAQVPDGSYGIELFSTDNIEPARTERFLIRARDLVPLADLYLVPAGGPRRYRIRVVLGAYSTREAALEAQSHLPPKYQQAFEPELRSYAELRQSL